MSRRDDDAIGVLLVLLCLGSRRGAPVFGGGRSGGGGSGMPYGPWTEDNTIPAQPVIPPNPLER